MNLNRLFEILYILIKKKHVTAEALAERFEVSVRTIYRDIDKLSYAGIPLYTSQGRGGGIFIDEKYVLSQSLLTQEEQSQILMALRSFSSAENENKDSLILKLSSLFQNDAIPWIEVDFSRWGHNPTDSPRFEFIKNSISNKLILSMVYINSSSEKKHRLFCPQKLIFKGQAWYVSGYCLYRKAYRFFKLSRIVSLHSNNQCFLPDELPPPPAETKKIKKPDIIHLSLRFSPSVGAYVFDSFDANSVEILDNGGFLVNVDWPHDHWIYGFLLSFGSSVEVISPKNVRLQLKKEAKKIKKIYED